MTNTKFDILYMSEAPRNTDGMTEFYHSKTQLIGFKGVYTEEGYDLAFDINLGMRFHKWSTDVKESGAVSYDERFSYYGEDFGTKVESYLKALDSEGNVVGSFKLLESYIGADDNFKEREQEFKMDAHKEFSRAVLTTDVYLQWEQYKKAKGL